MQNITKNITTKRTLATVLALVMLMTMLPVTVGANTQIIYTPVPVAFNPSSAPAQTTITASGSNVLVAFVSASGGREARIGLNPTVAAGADGLVKVDFDFTIGNVAGGSGSSGVVTLEYGNGNNLLAFTSNQGSPNLLIGSQVIASSVTTEYAISIVFDFTNNIADVYLDGVIAAAGLSIPAAANSVNSIRVNCNRVGGNVWWDMNIKNFAISRGEYSTAGPVLPESVTVTPASVADLAVGATVQLDVTVLPADAANKSVVWSSSNPDIASVSNTGLVTGVATGGPVTITATSSEVPILYGESVIMNVSGAASAGWTDEILDLPDAIFDVFGSKLDRGLLVASISSGVFLTWRYFPEEATGFDNARKSLTGADFAIYKNGNRIATVTDSTDYIDAAGTASDEYAVVTIVDNEYVSRTNIIKPSPMAVSGNNGSYLQLNLQRPLGTAFYGGNYALDESSTGDVDGDGRLEIVVKWQTAAPDVIQGGSALVIYDCYKIREDLSGLDLLWRIDMGRNIRGGQHYQQPMLFDFDGDGKAEFMTQTAPGTRWATVGEDGVLGEWTYITMPETVHTRWDGTKNWSHNDDYRSITTTAATRQNDPLFQWMVGLFKNWHSHPEVMEARWGPNLEFLFDSVEDGGFGWWKYPPQVMLGVFPAGYVGANGPEATAGANNEYRSNNQVTGWTLAQWEIVNAIPKAPEEFKNYTITDEDALALAYLWYRRAEDGERDRHRNGGHVIDGPEYFSVFCGETGAELDTIPLAVPRGIVHPITGKYTPDIGLLWGDMSMNQLEPMNRIERFNGAVGYLDGNGKNPSTLQVRGYYSRMTVARYDWDGEKLTSQVLVDSGYEVTPNPFHSRWNNYHARLINNLPVNYGAAGAGNIDGGPGRREGCFDPYWDESSWINSVLFEKPESIATLELAWKNGSITYQGAHHMTVMDVDGDGKDEIILGSAAFNSDGSLRWTTYVQEYDGSSQVPNGRIVKAGHSDSIHLAFFHPNQNVPYIWQCMEGGRQDEVLVNADTGEVIYHMQRGGSLDSWPASGGDNGRAMVGKFTSEPGWQLFTNTRQNTPLGANTGRGLRQWNGTVSASQTLSPGTNGSIFFRPNLLTQIINGTSNVSVQSNNGNGGSFSSFLSTSGTGVQGGSKGQANWIGDFFGDFREELFLVASNNLRIYFNTEDAERKLATHMADRRYRVETERQKSTYNQPVYPGYYYGADMDMEVYFDFINAERVVTHDVTFNPDNGAALWKAVVVDGEAVANPGDPSKYGANFLGWFLAGVPYDFATPVTANITLTAQWQAITFTVDYIVDGEPYASETVNYGGTAAPPAVDPVKYGHAFIGWFLDDDEFDFGTQIFADIELVAGWYQVPLESLRIGDEDGAPAAQMIALPRSGSLNFTLITNPEEVITDIVWSVNNPNLATVAVEDGIVTVTAKGMPGNVTLTVRDMISGITHSIVLRIA